MNPSRTRSLGAVCAELAPTAALTPTIAAALENARRVIVPMLRSLLVSRQDAFYELTVHIRQPIEPALELVCQLLVIHAHLVQDRRLQIVNVDRVLHNVVAEVVRRAVRDTRLDPAASHPAGEAARVMIASIIGGCQLALRVVR